MVVGRGYWRRDLNQEAFPVLTHLVEEYTDAEEAGGAAFILGRIHFEAGHLKKAIRQYRETRFLFPDTNWEEEAAWGEAWCYYLLGKYEACAEHLRECVSEEVWDLSIPRALYWQARCLERAGRLAESRVVYERTRNGYPDSYYSVLAEWRLTGKALKEVIAPQVEGVGAQANEPEEPKAFEKLADPALPLLVETGLLKDAVARLDWLRNGAQGGGVTQEDWVEAYCLAGDYLKGLRIAMQEGLLSPRLEEGIYGRDPDAKRFLHLLYPLPARFGIQEKARQRGLDPFLVAGLIHQESVFMHDAISPAGAVGLMQIMPATGRRVAEKIGLEGFTRCIAPGPGGERYDRHRLPGRPCGPVRGRLAQGLRRVQCRAGGGGKVDGPHALCRDGRIRGEHPVSRDPNLREKGALQLVPLPSDLWGLPALSQPRGEIGDSPDSTSRHP